MHSFIFYYSISVKASLHNIWLKINFSFSYIFWKDVQIKGPLFEQ